jgi:hypothetical protein
VLVFPQLSTGASVQYPVRRRRLERTIVNASMDGRVIALADEYCKQIQWDFRLDGLTDQEAQNYVSFYELCEGCLQSFLFPDPIANLLLYSEDLTQTAWQLSSLLAASAGIDDPYGTARATRLTNSTGAALTVTQTVALPGSVTAAFSVFLRAAQPAGFQVTRTDGSTVSSHSPAVSGSWNRFVVSSLFASSTSSSSDFAVSIPAGASLDVFGFQVDAQPAAATYVISTSESGIYPAARFAMNSLAMTVTGPGESSVQMSILSKSSQ